MLGYFHIIEYITLGWFLLGKINQIGNILANELFQKLLCKDKLKMAEINSIMCLLVNCNIPFELNFAQATTSTASAISITITIDVSGI